MTNEVYQDFVSRKLTHARSVGISDSWIDESDLFPHQAALAKWALRKGKAAIFASTGMGKTRIELKLADAVCRATGGNTLILSPLAVAEQTCREADKIGIAITHARDKADVKAGINITNYARLHRFDTKVFNCVIADESSVIKHQESKTLGILIDAFSHCAFRFPCTATPAPNDWTELGTHAEFLGICTVSEMLAEYFVHDSADTQTWRLKGHAKQAFWRWVASWGAMIQSPSDLGFDASAYALPPMNVRQITVDSDATAQDGMLFALEAQTLTERRQSKRDSLVYRVRACAEIVNASDEPWIIWCELNAEGDALRAAIPDAVEVRGSDDDTHKERAIKDFIDRKIRVMVSKGKIMGFGLNFQHCRKMAFIGAVDSFESYFQSVRRCWRFGQTKPVDVLIFASDMEGAILRNLQRKEADTMRMFESLSKETAASVRDEVIGHQRQFDGYRASNPIKMPSFLEHSA
jgi:hypothetical protein